MAEHVNRALMYDVIRVLKKSSPLTMKGIAKKLGSNDRTIRNILQDLEVRETRGRDPDNGRANVKFFSIELPKVKREALA